MRDGGFPVDDEDVLETMARMLAAAGETEAASLIRSGRCKFEWDHRDNWNGGTDCYVRIPEHSPTHSDNMRPAVPVYPPTSDALP